MTVRMIDRYAVSPFGDREAWAFAAVTLVSTVAILILVPGLGGPVIVVFIPTAVAVLIIRTVAGLGQVRLLLFSSSAWRIGWLWVAISLGMALAVRIGVSVLGEMVIADYEWQTGMFSPLLLGIFVFAAAEEIGWRGFALPALLARGHHPLTATLLLAVPWALLHLPLAGTDRLNEGWSLLALFLFMMAMSVLVSWIYLGAGFSLTAAVLFHGGQNALAVINDGIDPLAGGWTMTAVYGAAALIVILVTGGRLGLARGTTTGEMGLRSVGEAVRLKSDDATPLQM